MNDQTQPTNLKIPPRAGGQRRVEEPKSPQKKVSGFKKAMPYLIASGSTGIGFLFGGLLS